ncbi:MAG: class B sortase [Desulfoplanes sp.]|nr:class B sortase [Desulfoplanes sp.]
MDSKDAESKWLIYGKRSLFTILLAILVYNLYFIAAHTWESHRNAEISAELAAIKESHQELEENQAAEMHQEAAQEAAQEAKKAALVSGKPILERFQPLLLINEEVTGWISIDNTEIDYPVVKTSDNEFYLDHNFRKEKSGAGTIFMDYRNGGDPGDQNTILYGHNRKDGSMFNGLTKYKRQEYYRDHPVLEFSDLKEDQEWRIFSVYITDTDFNYIQTDFADEDDFQRFLEEISSKSMYDTGTDVSRKDQILTLSTCTYEFADARLVVHAKRID